MRPNASTAFWDHEPARAMLGMFVRVLLGFQRRRARLHGPRLFRGCVVVVAHRRGTAMILKFEALRADRVERERFVTRVLDQL